MDIEQKIDELIEAAQRYGEENAEFDPHGDMDAWKMEIGELRDEIIGEFRRLTAEREKGNEKR